MILSLFRFFSPLLIFLSFQSSAKEKVLWLVEDKTENLNLLDANSPNNSAATAVEREALSALKDYDVEVKRVSIKRINYLMKTNTNVCAGNRAKLKERERYSHYSYPQSFYLTHKLYRFNQATALPDTLFNDQGDLISIKALFDNNPQDHIGIVDGVSFGAYLDREISQLDPENIHYRGGIHRVSGLESMLYAGRFDYLLALPVDMNPTELQKMQLEQFNVAGSPPFVIAHFSCSKTDLGKQVIADINRYLYSSYAKSNFERINGPWYSTQDREEIQSYLKRNYLDNQFVTSEVAIDKAESRSQ